MVKPNLGFYVQKINQIVTDTEKIGEEMNPSFETIREAIDNDQTTEITEEKRQEIIQIFTTGTKQYQEMAQQISQLRPTARVLGFHKKLETSYKEYIAGCEDMIQSLSDDIDVEAFDAAEKRQDKASDGISFAISRMTNLLLK
ncbi:MAG TPA: hypothetical protein H9829_01940 [Candidatus Tetragenococcus pullicola]|nr:hypothetical protein [Candidatus Tetragenococcus pullicola]